MDYEKWAASVPEEIRGDALWKVEAYRLGLFAAEIGWHDATRLKADLRTQSLSDQLYRALGSVSANIAEGYSRASGREKARFYEYALGSARESRDWYYKGRHVLGETVCVHRLGLLTQIVRLLLTMVPQQRGRSLRDLPVAYDAGAGGSRPDLPVSGSADVSGSQTEPSSDDSTLHTWLWDAPLP